MRTNTILIRLDGKEKVLLEDAASSEGLPVSSWARKTLLEQVASDQKNKRTCTFNAAIQQPNDSYGGELLSLFCGPGGLDLGFEYCGFKTILAIDIDKDCVNTFNANRTTHVAHTCDIRTLDLDKLDNLAGKQVSPVGVIGGPPCQSFSYSNVHQKIDDPRHYLPMAYAELLSKLNKRKPISFFVFENVLGLLGSRHASKYSTFKQMFEEAGFELFEQRLDSKDFGVAQSRPRLIIVGINRELHPECEWIPPEALNTKITVRDVMFGLDEPIFNSSRLDSSVIPVHPNHICMVPRSQKFLNGITKPGTVKGRCFRVLSWDEPSWTVAYGNREVHVHPNGNRRLSMYEAMKLQSFPDWYQLVGNLSAQVRLVSEAVPPRLSCYVADSIRASLGI